MSAGAAVQAALVAALRDGVGASVFDAPPVRGAVPHVVVDDPVLRTWRASGVDGRDGRVSIAIHDAGERPVRLRVLAGQVEDRAAALSGDVGDGWRLVALRLVRARTVRGGGERWTATLEFSVQAYRAVAD